MSAESREHNRRPLRLQLNYRDATGGNFLYQYSQNISKGGIFIETDTPMPSGASLVVRFAVPDSDDSIEVEGTVVWVNEFKEGGDNPNPGMGIQWTNLDDEARGTIAAVVKAIAILPD
ncbi:MAG: TIGR02266 family protein [Proteobacteria bacterium]|nr:TIGR02266 family protein [Pseudomonadota bacterium]